MSTTYAIAKHTESKIDVSKLCDKLSKTAHQVVAVLESKLQKDGSFGYDAKDIACYFKSPMMFLTADKPQAASAVLNYIKSAFMSKARYQWKFNHSVS